MSAGPSEQPASVAPDGSRGDAPCYLDDAGDRLVQHRILGRGGEGTVISISGEPSLAAKIYHPRRPVPEEKLRWMIEHPLSSDGRAGVAAAWPLRLLWRDDGSLAGYLMPRVAGLELRSVIAPIDQPARSTLSVERAYRLLAHLAHAVDQFHRNRVVICDLQPRNILVTETDDPVLLDADSFQVSEQTVDGVVVHHTRVVKFEYLAPERFGGRLSATVAHPESDWHAFAIVAFRLLVGGLHPLIDAGAIDPSDQGSTRQERRRQLLRWRFRFGNGSATPADQRWFYEVPPQIRSLLTRSFTAGILDPAARPQSAAWVDALNAATRELATCWDGHVFPGHLTTCPTCAELV